MSGPSRPPLAPSRVRVVDEGALRGVVVEVDATDDPDALAVLQAGLHELPEGVRLIHGYDLAPSGLGAWIGDRRVRLRVWPAYLDEHGDIEAAGPEDPAADVLVIDLDPATHAEALAFLVHSGRLFIAGPEAGPTPLVIDLDTDLVGEVIAETTAGS